MDPTAQIRALNSLNSLNSLLNRVCNCSGTVHLPANSPLRAYRVLARWIPRRCHRLLLLLARLPHDAVRHLLHESQCTILITNSEKSLL